MNLNCIQKILIYCSDIKKYQDKYSSNKKICYVTNKLEELITLLVLKSVFVPDYDKNIKKDITHNPLISYYEYNKYYYIYHKILSFFFKEDYSVLNFNEGYMKEMFEFVEKNSEFNENQKIQLKNIIKDFKDSKEFLRKSLLFLTSENDFIYVINKTMRKIEEGSEQLSFLIGPMYYNMVRYLKKENPNLILDKSSNLYRNITISKYDLNIYTMALGNIICFSSFTSTSFKKGEFTTTVKALKANNLNNKNDENKDELIKLTMVLHYNYFQNNEPIGMILADFSKYIKEEEFLLFPFTFIKVNRLDKINDNSYDLDCNIINKNSILEFGLKKGKKVNVENDVLIIK